MVGGGNRRDDGSFTVSNSNVFAALESLRKKKKSDKDKGSSRGSKSKAAAGKSKEAEEEKLYWAPAPLTTKSWADVDDEDDDDYYATTAPPQAMWGGTGLSKTDEMQKPDPVEETESEDELLDEGDDDVEDELDHEPEPEPMLEKHVEISQAPKETERQLSKKELKKKELAELEAILADFGVNPKDKAEDEPSDALKGKINEDAEKKDNIPTESKSAKKKKKKDKTSKEAKETQDNPNSSDVTTNGQGEPAGTESLDEDASSAVDVKERLKKVASAKKKKTVKDLDGAARAAAIEAAARSAKLAAAKKKEKSRYNQQPTR